MFNEDDGPAEAAIGFADWFAKARVARLDALLAAVGQSLPSEPPSRSKGRRR